MKQIRLKRRIIKIKTCADCPIDECKFICNSKCHMILYDDKICENCPLEDWEDED